MPTPNYDIWKTSPPEDEMIEAGECACGCEQTLYDGDSTYYDSRIGEHFTDRDCYKRYLIANISDEVEEFIDLLKQNNDVRETEIEAD